MTSRGHKGAKNPQQRDVGMGILSILWFPFLTYRHLLRLACNVSILTHCEDSHLSTSKMYIFLLFITYKPRLLRSFRHWATIPVSYRICSKDPATYIKKTACFGLSGRSCTYILRYMKPHRVGKPCEGGASYWRQGGGKVWRGTVRGWTWRREMTELLKKIKVIKYKY